ncbi:MAG TPA: response regulator [Bryobacteraceae bacterium]|nr:response regulator [Bryobacteraceae bacterium]
MVEDEAAVALEFQGRLTALGYEVPNFASTGEQAIQFIEQRLPDLVLMDVVLTGAMSGTQAAKLIRGAVPNARSLSDRV